MSDTFRRNCVVSLYQAQFGNKRDLGSLTDYTPWSSFLSTAFSFYSCSETSSSCGRSFNEMSDRLHLRSSAFSTAMGFEFNGFFIALIMKSFFRATSLQNF